MQGFVWKMKTHIVLGYGCTNDAYHITSPREDGEAAAKAGLQNEDAECDLDYTKNVGKNREVKYAMSNSFGFGGHNASLIFSKYLN